MKNANQVLQVQVKDVFGVKRVYPLSAEGLLLLELTGMKSFSDAHLALLKQMGYTIEVIAPTLETAG